MKKLILAGLLLGFGTLAQAQERHFPEGLPPDQAFYLTTETQALRLELKDRKTGDLTGEETFRIQDRLSVALQKDLFVWKTAQASLIFPGAAQFRTGHNLEGAGFMAANLGILAGTLIAAYQFLPQDLKMDYLGNSFSYIDSKWKGHSFNDYLPSLGILALGMVAEAGVHYWSYESGKAEAREFVDQGKEKFEPQFNFTGLGINMRY